MGKRERLTWEVSVNPIVVGLDIMVDVGCLSNYYDR